MKIQSISYLRRFTGGLDKYEHEELAVEASLDEDDNKDETLAELRDFVARNSAGMVKTRKRRLAQLAKYNLAETYIQDSYGSPVHEYTGEEWDEVIMKEVYGPRLELIKNKEDAFRKKYGKGVMDYSEDEWVPFVASWKK
jgi:hypothetical protein